MQERLVSAMKSIGISLKFWVDKKTKKLEWTSMMGGDKKRMLKKLPAHFAEFLPRKDVAPTQKLWQVNPIIYNGFENEKILKFS